MGDIPVEVVTNVVPAAVAAAAETTAAAAPTMAQTAGNLAEAAGAGIGNIATTTAKPIVEAATQGANIAGPLTAPTPELGVQETVNPPQVPGVEGLEQPGSNLREQFISWFDSAIQDPAIARQLALNNAELEELKEEIRRLREEQSLQGLDEIDKEVMRMFYGFIHWLNRPTPVPQDQIV